MSRTSSTGPRPDRHADAAGASTPERPLSGHEALRLIETVSRRIDALARDLNILGHFEDGHHDRPRAA